MKKYTQKFLSSSRWVCRECGEKYGRKLPEVATYNTDICGVCGKETTVTQPRDYGYLHEIINKRKS